MIFRRSWRISIQSFLLLLIIFFTYSWRPPSQIRLWGGIVLIQTCVGIQTISLVNKSMVCRTTIMDRGYLLNRLYPGNRSVVCRYMYAWHIVTLVDVLLPNSLEIRQVPWLRCTSYVTASEPPCLANLPRQLARCALSTSSRTLSLSPYGLPTSTHLSYALQCWEGDFCLCQSTK